MTIGMAPCKSFANSNLHWCKYDDIKPLLLEFI